ncbi:cytochrome c biogenesis protein transmembrane region [Spirochaeta thermophila DSM 6578]|uniref:Cytochrome c biogenesis protein transmembrane region n=1 Tax=Winmispira thermophila (strain ATCC 700085 / DSM 6578 / Z-1203) TaxID=869211 RepID=G0GFG3_WINT7|nr:cytochrome c biogenesis protein CcdA [Spirochaeta thermophila]AEJ61577.1 cytochrome c biogenesis protein transmembrane region [Spirochaeta thermophila DSM 6578]
MSGIAVLPLALLGGVLSFLSPCVLPMVPVYLSLVSGVSVRSIGEERGAVLRAALGFVLGFSIVFAVLGFVTSRLVGFFSLDWVRWVSGGLVILFGIHTAFDLVPGLNVERRVHVRARAGFIQAVVLGLAFGAGWSPCVGPILAGILVLAGQAQGAGTAIGALLLYAVGLGVPFLLVAVFFERLEGVLSFFKRHATGVRLVSGGFLVGVGVLIVTNRVFVLNAALSGWALGLYDAARSFREAHPVIARLGAGGVLVLLGGMGVWRGLVRRSRGRGGWVWGVAVGGVLGVLGALGMGGVWDPGATVVWVLGGGATF